jgi:hypothetical protein
MDSNVCRVMPDDSLSLFVQYVNCDRMNCTKPGDEQTLIGCMFINYSHVCTDVPPHLQVMCSKTYRSHVKPQIILNNIYNMIYM